MWDDTTITALSHLPNVARVVALGSVLAVELHTHTVDSGGGGCDSQGHGGGGGGENNTQGHATGYDSNATARIVQRLAEAGVYARPLGNVMYVMVTPMTPRSTAVWLQGVLYKALQEE